MRSSLCSFVLAAALGPFGSAGMFALVLPALLPTSARAEEALPALPSDTPGSLRHFVDGLSPEVRDAARRRLDALGVEERRHFYERWNALPEGQRRRVERRLRERASEQLRHRKDRRALEERYESMSSEQRRHFRKEMQRWKRMPPEKRRVMRERLDRFKGLTPEQQRKIVDRKFHGRSAAERQQILQRLQRAGRVDRRRGRAFRGAGPERHHPRRRDGRGRP